MRITPAATSLAPPTQTLEHVLGSDPAVLRGFAKAIQDKLAVGPLSLRERDRLISRGVRLGLKRFDANLVIASVEQQQRPGLRLATSRWDDPSERSVPRWLRWSTVAALQSAIIGAAWWFLH